ncbi:MAG: threonylcarbamoyl-AMP synthase [Treponema sp.]|jgi:L-threonylcarbamoyladenylate synthase|nr:threonylcarbamoyl-AMP synthase [Treponema sp.]
MIYPVTEESLRLAAAAIRAGELAAFPTETVYGLGGDAFNPRALAKIFQVKGRPRFDPLIVHIARLESLEDVADLSALGPQAREHAARLAAEFWPGPLTLVLPKRASVPDLATSGLATVAVRFPSHPAARELIRLSTGAVAAPSANRFGCLSPTRAEHVAEQLGDRLGIILDGGPAAVGVESTVLDMTAARPRILRPGGLSRARLEALLGPLPGPGETPGELCSPGELRSPGLLPGHYAPRTPLCLHGRREMAALPYREDEAYLFFSRSSRESWGMPGAVEVLSDAGDSVEAAANLFDALHRLDRLGLRRIHAEAAPPELLGEAINDRLGRAAAGVLKPALP